MKKEKYLKQHPYRIYQGADGYWRTDVRDGDNAKRRTIRRKTKEDLENSLRPVKQQVTQGDAKISKK